MKKKKNNKKKKNKKKKNKKKKTLPLLARDVLLQTLIEKQVPFVVIDGDGDRELAAIANEMEAYVLASDTDFCLFDLTKGFLPLKNLNKMKTEGNAPYVECKIFRRQKLIDAYKIRNPAATSFLFPMMSWQDGLDKVEFDEFFLPHSQRNHNQPFWLILDHLLSKLAPEYLRDDDNLIHRMKIKVPELPTGEFQKCLKINRDLPDIKKFVEKLVQGGEKKYETKFVVTPILQGNPSRVYTDFLPVVPDDQRRQSAHTMSQAIRKSIFAVMFAKIPDLVPRNVKVFDRYLDEENRPTYDSKMIPVDLDITEMEPLQLHSLNDELMKEEVERARKTYILNILLRGREENLIASFSNEMKLTAAVLVYWSYSDEIDERQSDEAEKALAFTIALHQDGLELPENIDGFPDEITYWSALHSSTQWLCCLDAALSLNILLGSVFETPKMGKLFSGDVFQRAFAYFKKNNGKSGEELAGDLLSPEAENARQLFISLLGIMN